MSRSAERGALRVVPAIPDATPYPITLPHPAEPIVGRTAEVDRGVDLVANGARLVTVTGPAGVGKTRLAVEIADRVARQLRLPVIYVELAAIAERALVVPAIAGAAGIEVAGEQLPADAVTGGIGDRATLLVIDNAEHLIGAVSEVIGLAERCPGLQIVLTSRVASGIAGEALVVVQPLSVPALNAGSSADLAGVESVALLVRHVQRFDPGYVIGPGQARAIAEICRRLEGLPLAIELAAARLRLLAPDELARLLGESLAILRSGLRDAPPHQRTLRAAIEWSYQLLEPDDRRVLRTVSVFAGGFTFDAVAEVAGGDRFDVLDQLERLVAHHLVRVGGSDPAVKRFDLFESIREFGDSELDACGERDATRDAHAAWCADLVGRGAEMLTGPGQAEAMAQLTREIDNIRAALAWLGDERTDDAGLRLATHLWRYWWMRGAMSEGRRWLDQTIAGYRGVDNLAVGTALRANADLAEEQGDSAAAEGLLLRAVAILEGVGDEIALAEAWNSLGIVSRSLSDFGRAEAFHQKAYDTFAQYDRNHRGAIVALNALAHLAYIRGDWTSAASRWQECADRVATLGDRRSLGAMLSNVAAALQQLGDHAGAAARNEEALAIAREVGDSMGAMNAMSNLGGVYVSVGDIDRGADLLDEALAIARDAGANYPAAVCLHSLSRVARSRGDLRHAGERLLESLRLFHEVGFTPGFADCLETLGSVALESGRPADALGFLSAGESWHDRHGSANEDDADQIARDIATVHATLDAVEIAAARSHVASWTRADAVAAAAVLVPTLARPTAAEPDAAVRDACKRVGLTARELEIVGHLVQRHTDQEIADRLFISTRTVTTHVSAVLRKLGVSSRREVASRARDLGLSDETP